MVVYHNLSCVGSSHWELLELKLELYPSSNTSIMV